ncbi:hypothetical protein CA13_31250 [Planctomycetes bacterium CA13]|uniref:Uncharacterized protein n=1 Tax=Novipirellula herctigrandis TaxID=2527986 RepID=A0A5C5Z2R3_9BACT|nr:hypothetical protein CA13_31250 [Planctomycetes bacterium CA13]
MWESSESTAEASACGITQYCDVPISKSCRDFGRSFPSLRIVSASICMSRPTEGFADALLTEASDVELRAANDTPPPVNYQRRRARRALAAKPCYAATSKCQLDAPTPSQYCSGRNRDAGGLPPSRHARNRNRRDAQHRLDDRSKTDPKPNSIKRE